MLKRIVPAALLAVAIISPISSHASDDQLGYGVDASFPIHYNFLGPMRAVSRALETFGPQKINMYTEFMEGCKKMYENKAYQCDHNEEDRLRLNRDQPKQMTNYTDIGFKKIRLPDEIWALLREYWGEIMKTGGVEALEEEYWPEANTYTNHWTSPSRMHYINHLHEPIWRVVEEKVHEWIPQASSFSRSSLYGIRVYPTGSILATHVDRDPLITSAIINVGQDVDEDWPLEVYDHDGRAHNITMQPGDLVLYESHSILHGRPFPLKGKYFANIFVHFKPVFDDGDSVIVKDEL